MDEKVRIEAPHRVVDAHASNRRIDSETLSHGVAGPEKTDIARDRGAGSEAACGRLAQCTSVTILKTHSEKECSAGLKVPEINAAGEVGSVRDDGSLNPAKSAEVFCGRVLHNQ